MHLASNGKIDSCSAYRHALDRFNALEIASRFSRIGLSRDRRERLSLELRFIRARPRFSFHAYRTPAAAESTGCHTPTYGD
jgi:hypothetical protein